jgi:hypothetical protein
MGNFYSMTTDNMNNNTNDTSNPFNPSDINEIIDYIAGYYILTMDFESLNKLLKKKYCDDLIILTSNIMEKYLTKTEIEFLEQKILNGKPINEVDVSNKNNKKRICLSIAKFYIKIAHVFASIVTTINPTYRYQQNGMIVSIPLYKKHTIPKDVTPTLHTLGICENRINSLKGNENYDDITQNTRDNQVNEIKVQPNVCSINFNMDGSSKYLTDEPGIPELMHLYFDDNYNYETGQFSDMSTETKKEYLEDVKRFYQYFTGNNIVPDDIKEFRDVKLKDYNSKSFCKTRDAANKQYSNNPYDPSQSVRNELFLKYAQNVNSMIHHANENQEQLLTIINEIFTYTEDPDTKTKNIRVNPKLNSTMLQDIIVKTRNLIISLYLTCEMDYTTGIKLYEAIIESTILSTTPKQINTLNMVSEKMF